MMALKSWAGHLTKRLRGIIRMRKKRIYVALTLTWMSTCGISVAKTDYMQLTKENMPHMQQLIQGALKETGINLHSSELTHRIRKSALYPDLTIRGHYFPEGVSEYDLLSYQSNRREESNGNISVETVDEYKQIGFSDRTEWAVTFEWNFTKLIHSHEERSLSARRSQLASLKRRRSVDVARRYAQLYNVLPETKAEPADVGKMAIIYEHAIMLDVWTGGMITLALEADRAESMQQNLTTEVASSNPQTKSKGPILVLTKDEDEEIKKKASRLLEIMNK
jgi:hypothetical protein